MTALTTDGAGNVYLLANPATFLEPGWPTGGRVVFIVRPDRTAATFAGTGTAGYSGDGSPATSAQINATDLAADDAGNVYLADSGGRTRKVDAGGTITTLQQVGGSTRLAIDSTGNLYLEWQGSVKRLKPDGALDYVAGVLAGGPAVSGGMAVDRAGNLYFANIQVTKADRTGAVSLVAGLRVLRRWRAVYLGADRQCRGAGPRYSGQPLLLGPSYEHGAAHHDSGHH